MENVKHFYTAIGRRIADARQSIGLSQEDAAFPVLYQMTQRTFLPKRTFHLTNKPLSWKS